MSDYTSVQKQLKYLRIMLHFTYSSLIIWSVIYSSRKYLLWAYCVPHSRASLVIQRLTRLPPMWETWVQSLGQEDFLEKAMAPHSSILAWKIPWTEEPGRLQSMGSQRVGHDWATSLSFTTIWSTLKCWDLHKEWYEHFFLFPEAFY